MKELSVIIANRNDTVMLSVTVNSCIEELVPIGHDKSEIIICDNSDDHIYDNLKGFLPSGYMREKLLKVFRQDFPCLFTARERAAEAATGKYIVCLDSHMIVGRNMLLDLYNFMEARKNDSTLGFAHAPINWAHHHIRNSRHDRDMRQNELGDWFRRYDHERMITWKGMPWICRREWFLDKELGLNAYGALSQHRISWGGGDMHIGIKPWLLGYKNWAVPCRPAVHIGPFPKNDLHKGKKGIAIVKTDDSEEYKYRVWSASGNGPHAFGFLVSCYVLGGESMMKRNKTALHNRFGRFINIDKWWHKAMEYGADEKRWLDVRKKMTFKQLLERKPWENGTESSSNDAIMATISNATGDAQPLAQNLR